VSRRGSTSGGQNPLLPAFGGVNFGMSKIAVGPPRLWIREVADVCTNRLQPQATVPSKEMARQISRRSTTSSPASRPTPSLSRRPLTTRTMRSRTLRLTLLSTRRKRSGTSTRPPRSLDVTDGRLRSQMPEQISQDPTWCSSPHRFSSQGSIRRRNLWCQNLFVPFPSARLHDCN
jgi:hypothetical protein